VPPGLFSRRETTGTSIIFTYISSFFQFGVGLVTSDRMCNAAIQLCVTAYAATKIFSRGSIFAGVKLTYLVAYLFLLERLFIVSGYHRYRESKAWLVGVTSAASAESDLLAVWSLPLLRRAAHRGRLHPERST
jgi:hypothetical protein